MKNLCVCAPTTLLSVLDHLFICNFLFKINLTNAEDYNY